MFYKICLFLADLLPQGITPQYKEVELGRSVTFECLSVHTLEKASPGLIPWIFNFGYVSGYATIEMPLRLKLHIEKVHTIHSGNYTCIGYHFSKKDLGLPAPFIATAVLKVFGMYYVNQFIRHITFCNKTLGRAWDLRANGAWLNKLTK